MTKGCRRLASPPLEYKPCPSCLRIRFGLSKVVSVMRKIRMSRWYVAIIPLFALAFLLVSCSNASNTSSGSNTSSAAATQTASMPTATPKADELAAARASFKGTLLAGKHTVILHTSKGDITFQLDAGAAPKTVTNFLTLAQAKYYDNLTFHRVINKFMIQGGDPSGNGTGGESIFGPSFEDEINADSYGLQKIKVRDVAQGQQIPPGMQDMSLKDVYAQQGMHFNSALKSIPFKRGVIAMANRGPDTNGSQFFILQNEATAKDLMGKYTVFGKVTAGMNVVDAIAATPTGQNDMPTTPVTFTVEVKS